MDWEDERERIRRYLRDPDENIWTDAVLLRLFNEEQRDLQRKTLILEDVEALRVPPLYNVAYLYDWEWPYFNNAEGKNYQALHYHQQTEKTFCYNFEATIDVGFDDSTADEGYHFTQPWEAFMDDVTPGDLVPIWFPPNFGRAKLLAWDREPLEYIPKKNLQSDDSSWLTHSGKTSHYWRYDDIENTFILWPLPSSPVWDDIESPSVGDLDYVYTYAWEESGGYVSGAGQEFTQYNSTDLIEHIFDWEGLSDYSSEDAVAMRGQWLHERGEPEMVDQEGILNFIVGDSLNQEVGGVVSRAATLFSSHGYGVAVDVIDIDDNVLLIFQVEPTDIESGSDESDFPAYLRKYLEYGVLERAYSANTDGRIESLRDYWAFRREIGLKIVKRFMQKRKVDRDYRLVTPGAPGRRWRRHPRLPDEYPAI